MRVVVFALALVVTALVGCTKAEEHAAAGHDHGAETKAAAEAAPKKMDREAVDPDGVVRRGQKLSESPVLTVAELSAKAQELDGKTVKVQGPVDTVCQPMGCWFVIKDGEHTIRVSSKGHDVFMPKSSAGKVAVAEGEFKLKNLTKEQAQHFEDEKNRKEGEERKVFTEDVKELSIALVGVELRPAS